MRSTLAVPGCLLALSLPLAACADSAGPSPATRMSVADPAGDEFSTSASEGLVPPDIIRFEAWPEADSLRIEVEFVNAVTSPAAGDANSVYGLIELDIDRNRATGVPSNVDYFRPDAGSTGMGVDYILSLFIDPIGLFGADGAPLMPIFGKYEENSLTLAVPLSAIGGGDGDVKMAVIVGTVVEPTDIAPDNGSLTIAGVATAAVAPGGAAGAAVRVPPRGWAR